MVNPLQFPGAERLLPAARAAGEAIARLRAALAPQGVPTIFVNDNFGFWNLSFRDLVEHIRSRDVLGRALLGAVEPEPGDHFVLKPKHSGFYSSSLDVLLAYLGTRRLLLTGVSTNSCVLFTANDAYMRDYEVVVPADCTAAETAAEHEWALRQMHATLKADTRPARFHAMQA